MFFGGIKRKIIPASFTSEGEAMSNNVLIAKGFNDYLCNVATSLAQNIQETLM